MTTTTIIAHKVTSDGFAVVVTTFAPKFRATYQVYKALGSRGHLQLVSEKVFTNEEYALDQFNYVEDHIEVIHIGD